MANNPYLEDNPYLNGNFNINNEPGDNKSTSAPAYEEPQTVNMENVTGSENINSKNNQTEQEFDILDAHTYINGAPKKAKEEPTKPYKEIKQKNSKEPKTNVKFSFKSFFLGILLACVILISSLGITIAVLYNSFTFAKLQKLLNTQITDGDLNDYTIKDLFDLAKDYSSLTIGLTEELLGFNLNDLSEDVMVGDLFEELSQEYLGKSYKSIKVTDIGTSLNVITNDLTINHLAVILSDKNQDGQLKYFKQEIVSEDICEVIKTSYENKSIKVINFFGEDLGKNLNYISLGTLVSKILTINENSTKIEKFVYNAFNESTHGIYDLTKNYNAVIDECVQIKDVINSFIDENTDDAFLKILYTTFKDNTNGITSIIENLNDTLAEIKVSTIVKSLWPNIEDVELNSSYDSFIKLIYEIYSDPKKDISIVEFINNISSQLNYIKVDDVINAFLGGDTKLEQFIQSVYLKYTNLGIGDFIDNFMDVYINDISVKNIIETFLESNNKFVEFLISIYGEDKYNEIGISNFIENFVEEYSKDITLDKFIAYFVNQENPTNFEALLIDLWGTNKTPLIDALSNIKDFINETSINDFITLLKHNVIITPELYNMIRASICDNNGAIQEEFINMGAYDYIASITTYLNNITIEEILENTQNLPPLVEEILKIFADKGIIDAIEDPVNILTSLSLRKVAQMYFNTLEGAKDFKNNPNINIPSKFEEILKIEVTEKVDENNVITKIKMGDVTISEFLDNRDFYLNKITIKHLLEFLNENGALSTLDVNLYNFLINEFGLNGLLDFKNNASTLLNNLTVESIITLLEKMGALKGLKDSKKDYLINFITDKFGTLTIENFTKNLTTHLNTTTIEDLRDYIDTFLTTKTKTQEILLDVIDEIILNIKEDALKTPEEILDALKLNNFINSLYNNIIKITIEDICNIFEVDLTANEGENFTIYAKLINRIKDKTLEELINDSENILESTLKNIIEELTIGQTKATFNIDIGRIFQIYGEDTKLKDIFEDFDELTIGHIIGDTSSSLLQKFAEIKLTEISHPDRGIEGTLDYLQLGELIDINKIVDNINPYSAQTTVQNYFDNKYITFENISKDTISYLIYENGEFKEYADINSFNNSTDYEEAFKIQAASLEIAKNNITQTANQTICINFEAYYKFEGGKLIQIKSSQLNGATATDIDVENYNPAELVDGKIYTTKYADNKYYRLNMLNSTWDLLNSPLSSTSYSLNAFDEALKYGESNLMLYNDALKLMDSFMVYNGEHFVYFNEFTESNRLLTLLKHTYIGDLFDEIEYMTIGEFFGENSILVDLVGGDSSIQLDEVDSKISVKNLTIQKLGELHLIDIENINSTYLTWTLQDVINEFLK